MNRQDRQSQHWQIKSAYTRALGPVEQPRHLLEVGGEVHYLSLDGSYRNRPVEVRGEAGQLLRSIEFRGGERLNSDKFEWALFAQDRFRPSQRFWVDLGLRVSDDQATDGVQLAPRLGIAWDLFGGSGTLLKASAGVLFRRILMAELAWERLPTRIGTRFSSGAGDEVVVLTPRLSDDLDSPRAVLGTIELSHRFNDRLTARVRYSYRDSRKQLVFDAVDGLGPAADVGMPPGSAPTASLLLSNAGSSLYRELVLAANLRLGRHDQMFFSYTWSSTEGDLNDPSLLSAVRPDPVLRRNQRAALRFDTPHRIVVWGTLNLPWDIIAAPVIEWRKGFPWSVLAEDQTYLGSANTERFPTYFRADVNITKGFRIRGYALRMGVLLQNFTTHFNPRDVIANVASPRFGELLNSERLRVRLRFSASF